MDKGQPEIEAGAPRGIAADFRPRLDGELTMTNFVKTFLNDESGASAAEYALILVIVGVAIVAGALALGGAVGDAMSDAAECINTDGVTCP